MKERISHVLSGVEFSTYEDDSDISTIKVSSGDSYDTFGMAVNNGLYDPRMGAQRDHLCQTCKQPEMRCPGHFGYIDLKVPVLHPMFASNFIKVCNSICWSCKNVMLKKRELVKSSFIAYALDIGDEVLLEQFMSQEFDYETEVQIQDAAVEEDTETAYHNTFWKILNNSSSKKGYKHLNVPLKKKHMINDVLHAAISRKTCPHCATKAASFKIEQAYKVSVYNTGEKSRIVTPMELLKFCQKTKGTGTFVLAILFDTVRVDLDLLRAICPDENYKYECSLPVESKWFVKFFIKRLLIAPPMFRPIQETNGMKSEHPLTMAYRKILETSDDIPKQSGIQQLVLQLVLQCLVNQVYDGNKEVSKITISKEESGKEQRQIVSMNSSLASSSGVNKQLFPGLKQVFEKKEGLLRSNCMGKRVNFAARSVISPDPFLKTTEIGIPPVFAMKLTFPERVTKHNILEMQRAVLNGPDIHPGASSVLINKAEKHLASLSKEERKSIALMLAQDTSTKTVMRHIKDGDVVLMNRQPTLHKPSMMAHTVKVLHGEKTLRMHYANCNSYNADFDGDEMNLHFFQSHQARSEAYQIASNKYQYLVPTSGEPIRGLIQDHIVAGVRICQKDTFFNKSDYCHYLGGIFNHNDRIVLQTPAIIKPVKLWTGKQIISTILTNISPTTISGISKGKVNNQQWSIRANKNKQQGKLGIVSPLIATLAQQETEESHCHVLKSILVTGVLDKNQIGASQNGLVHLIYKVLGPDSTSDFFDAISKCLSKWLLNKSHSCRMEDLLLQSKFDDKRNDLLSNQLQVAAEGIHIFAAGADIPTLLSETLSDSNKLDQLDSIMKSVNNKLTSALISTLLPNGLQKHYPMNGFQLMTATGAKGSNVNASQISCCLGQQELEGKRPPIMASGKSLPSFKPFEIHPRAGGFVADRFLSGIRPQEYYYHCMAGREGLIDTAVKTARSGYLQRCLIKHLEGVTVQYDQTVRDMSDSNGAVVQFLYGEDGLAVEAAGALDQFKEQFNNFISNTNLEPNTKILKQMSKAINKPYKYAPVTSVYSPATHMGACSEAFYTKLSKFVENVPNSNSFTNAMYFKYMRALVEPSTSVGVLAAQSIGEPSTQMTLNTFHFAGVGMKNVTLGIPRLREILMTASANIKTPVMRVSLVKVSKKIDTFVKQLHKVMFSDCIKTIKVETQYGEMRTYTATIALHDKETLAALYKINKGDLKMCLETRFIPKLMQRINKELKNKDVVDESAGIVKTEEVEMREILEAEEGDDMDDFDTPMDTPMEADDTPVTSDAQIVDKFEFLSRFHFNKSDNSCSLTLVIPNNKLQMLSILEQTSHVTICRQVSGISRAFVNENKIMIEGINLRALWTRMDLVDVHGIYTNDIHAILSVYGVEAARQAIVNEIRQVFDVYGISVDIRHLYLIGDYMTRCGGYMAFNRNGMSRHPSAMLKMTFETTCQVLQDTVLFNGMDDGKSPSTKLVLGDVVSGGTGSFDLMTICE